MDRISPNFVYMLDSLLWGCYLLFYCLFVTELWPLIDVRILFLLNIFRFPLLNIFRIWPFYCMKSGTAGL